MVIGGDMKKSLLLLFILILSFSLFGYSLCDGLLSFDIPKELEVQSDEYKKITKLISPDTEDYDLVLQQKGLNNYSSTDEYCRILIKINRDEDFDALSNADYRDVYSLLSKEEKDVIDQSFFDMLSTEVVIKKWYGAEELNLKNGTFVIRYRYEREDTKGESVVDTSLYSIILRGYSINITTAYKKKDEEKFKKAIDSFFDSLVLNEKDLNPLVLLKFPSSSFTFYWPEENVTWERISQNKDITVDGIIYSDIQNNGYLVTLKTFTFKKAQSSYIKERNALTIQNEFKNNIKQLSEYNYKITENSVKNGVFKFGYNYFVPYLNTTLYGRAGCISLSDKLLVEIEAEYLEYGEEKVNAIFSSLGL